MPWQEAARSPRAASERLALLQSSQEVVKEELEEGRAALSPDATSPAGNDRGPRPRDDKG